MTTRVVRYTTKPERADENAALIRDVFNELADRNPDGIRYTALRLDDGVSFVHVVDIEGDADPLSSVAAFGRFQDGIADRCVSGPTPAGASVVGTFG